VRWQTLTIDALIAAVVAVVALIVSPGVALTAVIALLVLLFCAISFGVEALAVRRRGRHRRARRSAPRD
jgi:hypothetical protein